MKVFFELNGQPRSARVPNRSARAAVKARPKADPANPGQIGAPMPGAIASVAVTPGQAVKAGDLLLTIEAMKMEAPITAPSDGTVQRVAVSSTAQVEGGDLLAVITAAEETPLE